MIGWFPSQWRRRYGAELEALVADMAAGGAGGKAGGNRLGTELDMMRAGLAERWRRAPSPVLVLWGWAFFVAGGATFAKWSEHFHPYTAAVAAYWVVVGAAVCGAVVLLAGALRLAPPAVRWLRHGGWAVVRARSAVAVVMSLAWAGALVGLAGWAHSLTGKARNGGDSWYTVAFLAFAVAGVAALFVWTSLATRMLSEVLRASDDRASGDRASGDRAAGDRAAGDRAAGDRAAGDRAVGDRAAGDRAAATVRTGAQLLTGSMAVIAAASLVFALVIGPLSAPEPVSVAVFMGVGLLLAVPAGTRRARTQPS